MIRPDHPHLQGRYGDLDGYNLDDPADLALAHRGRAAMENARSQWGTRRFDFFGSTPDLKAAMEFEWWTRGNRFDYSPGEDSVWRLPLEALLAGIAGNDELLAHDAARVLHGGDADLLLGALESCPYAESPWARYLRLRLESRTGARSEEEIVEALLLLDHHDALRWALHLLGKVRDPRYREVWRRFRTLHPCSSLIVACYQDAFGTQFLQNVRAYPPVLRYITRLEDARSRYKKRPKRAAKSR